MGRCYFDKLSINSVVRYPDNRRFAPGGLGLVYFDCAQHKLLRVAGAIGEGDEMILVTIGVVWDGDMDVSGSGKILGGHNK